MDLFEYINLLIQLKAELQTIWGFLLTVSLGIVAFIGSAQSVKVGTYLVLGLIFIGFAGSNFRALEKNFDTREQVKILVKDCKTYEKHSALVTFLTPNETFFSYKGISEKEGNLGFQVVISLLVLIVVFIDGYKVHKKNG